MCIHLKLSTNINLVYELNFLLIVTPIGKQKNIHHLASERVKLRNLLLSIDTASLDNPSLTWQNLLFIYV